MLVLIMELFSDIVAIFGKKENFGHRNNSLFEQIRCNGLAMTQMLGMALPHIQPAQLSHSLTQKMNRAGH